MKAIPVSFEISLNFECNGCGEILTLYNREIPSKIGRKERCRGCRKFIDIPIMDIQIDELEEKPVAKEDNDNKTGVINVLKSYGYSPEEVRQMISVITDFSQEPSVLLKIALASKEEE